MPNFTVMFAIAMFASVGLTGLNGFIGEFLTLKGAFDSKILASWWYTIFGATGVIFAAVYLLWMFQRVMYGSLDNPANKNLTDLNKKEWTMLVPIVVFIVWLGLYPSTFLNITDTYTKQLVNKIEMIKFNKPAFSLPEIGPAENKGNNK
jgi:NADH-quinone oxidoreductase subunit M